MIDEYISRTILVKQTILNDRNLVNTIGGIAKLIVNAYKKNKKVFTAGNGGSAADAQHMAGELVSRFFYDRPALNAISLTTDTSIITAIANDYGYDYVFARQIEANAEEGDVLIAISTSGNSSNILRAIEVAKSKNMVVIGLTGNKDCKMQGICDHLFQAPSDITPHIQEAHIMVIHIICALVERQIFPRI